MPTVRVMSTNGPDGSSAVCILSTDRGAMVSVRPTAIRSHARRAATACPELVDDTPRTLLIRPVAGGLYDRFMSLEWEQTTVDAQDPVALGNWWREALGWVVVNDDPGEFEIRPTADRVPGLLFLRVPGSKQTKNRLHFDFRPDDRDAEVERLLLLGATRVDIGQGEQSWTVLADPEGNEFCVLGSRAH